MNKDKKLRLLLAPLIFMVLMHVPMMILENVYIQEMPELIQSLYVVVISILIVPGMVIYHYIPIGVYIAIVIIYTVVSWTWILRQKKGNVIYFIVWLVLCVFLILMCWEWGPEYYMLTHG